MSDLSQTTEGGRIEKEAQRKKTKTKQNYSASVANDTSLPVKPLFPSGKKGFDQNPLAHSNPWLVFNQCLSPEHAAALLILPAENLAL